MWNLPQPGFELVSCTGRQILYHWATKEALMLIFDWVLWHECYFAGFWIFLYFYKHSRFFSEVQLNHLQTVWFFQVLLLNFVRWGQGKVWSRANFSPVLRQTVLNTLSHLWDFLPWLVGISIIPDLILHSKISSSLFVSGGSFPTLKVLSSCLCTKQY